MNRMACEGFSTLQQGHWEQAGSINSGTHSYRRVEEEEEEDFQRLSSARLFSIIPPAL